MDRLIQALSMVHMLGQSVSELAGEVNRACEALQEFGACPVGSEM